MLHAIDRVLAPVTWLLAAFAVAVLVFGPELVGAEKPPPTTQQAEATATSGKEIFIHPHKGLSFRPARMLKDVVAPVSKTPKR